MTDIEGEGEGRLFIENVYEGGFYVKMNIDLMNAAKENFKLTFAESGLLYDICSYYESNTIYNKAHTPLEVSLRDLAIKNNASTKTIEKALKALLNKNLIHRENDGKQKSKYGYYPNVELLRNNLLDYVRLLRRKDRLKKGLSVEPDKVNGLKNVPKASPTHSPEKAKVSGNKPGKPLAAILNEGQERETQEEREKREIQELEQLKHERILKQRERLREKREQEKQEEKEREKQKKRERRERREQRERERERLKTECNV
jgi:hypothetical protein